MGDTTLTGLCRKCGCRKTVCVCGTPYESSSKANQRQEGGSHYKMSEGVLEHWDIVAQHELSYFQGNITKYVMRYKKKNGIEDLKKARHYLDKLIELEEAAAATRKALGF